VPRVSHTRITILPVATPADFGVLRQAAESPNVLDLRPGLIVRRGAVAMQLCLRAEGIGRGDEVLLPAFHCRSMVAPILAVGATPVFYGITEELQYDFADLTRRISRERTRAIMVPHFFGRIQNLAPLRELCGERIVLIEDCAHALLSASDRQLGEWSDYVIASPRKFVPVPEGGFLGGRKMNSAAHPLASRSLHANLRVLYDIVDLAVAAGRMRLVGAPLAGARKLRHLLRPESVPLGNSVSAPSSPADEEVRAILSGPEAATGVTRFLLAHWQIGNAARIRRRNYESLVQLISGARDLRVLQSSLPLSPMPYMVPVMLANPDVQFAQLKQTAVPIWRWEESQRGVCAVTDWYAKALVQVPCHQSLDPAAQARIERVFV
jgi:perosamine synthetase